MKIIVSSFSGMNVAWPENFKTPKLRNYTVNEQ